MCSDFCICPGIPTDPWYKQYEEIPAPMYDKYNRTFLGYNGDIDLQRFGDPTVKKPLFWTYDPSDKTKQKENLKKLSSKSMIECLDNIEDIGKAYKLQQETSYLKQLTVGGMSEADAKKKVSENTLTFDGMGDDVKKNKPDKAIIDMIKFIESEYTCSGMCSASLFYLVNPVTQGPPT